MKDMYMKVRDEHIETLKKLGTLQKEHADKVNSEHEQLDVAGGHLAHRARRRSRTQRTADTADMMCMCSGCVYITNRYSKRVHGMRERVARHCRTIRQPSASGCDMSTRVHSITFNAVDGSTF